MLRVRCLGKRRGVAMRLLRFWERIKVDFEIRVATRWGRDAANVVPFWA